jgi:hypothetical protein
VLEHDDWSLLSSVHATPAENMYLPVVDAYVNLQRNNA